MVHGARRYGARSHRFVSLTIRRSVLHQGLVVGLLAGAGGLVLNSLLSANWWHEPLDAAASDALVWTLLWAPMTMVFLSIPAIRLALSVPLDLRANWIFRMTEDVEAGPKSPMPACAPCSPWPSRCRSR